MNHADQNSRSLSRRSFVRQGALYLLGAGAGLSHVSRMLAEDVKPGVRLGLITDLHYADKPPAGSRHYRETLTKLEQVAEQFERDRPQAVLELGDLIDAADSVAVEQGYLKRIHREFAGLPGEKHCVLGNHCVYTLTKEEFLEGVEQKKSHYSFDLGGVHCVILDACFNSKGQPYGRKNFVWTDTSIPAEQVEWLAADLKAATGPVIVFVHQRLDVSNHYGVNNAAAVRKVLEDSGKVLAVLQGHSHKNDHREIGGIHYCVLAAMVEGSGDADNACATLDVFEGGAIRISGFRRQQAYSWE